MDYNVHLHFLNFNKSFTNNKVPFKSEIFIHLLYFQLIILNLNENIF